jgi:hypothetical protein
MPILKEGLYTIQGNPNVSAANVWGSPACLHVARL